MSATDIYVVYLDAIVGATSPSIRGGAPTIIAHRLGEMARTKNEMPDDRVTVESTVATVNGTGRGFGLDAAAAYLKANPSPVGSRDTATGRAQWLAAAVQALGAAPEAKS